MDNEKKITKVVISSDDELTDVVTAILTSRNERIVLTFAEETDLLISPINLKVLLETADEAEKMLVAQIIKNPTGLRNANLAGLSTIDSPQFPDEEVWETEEINRAKRLTPPKKKPSKKASTQKEDIDKKDEPTDFQKRIDAAIAKNKQKRDAESSGEDVLITLDEDLPDSDSSEPEITLMSEDPGEKGQPQKDAKEPNLSKVDFKNKTANPVGAKPEDKKKKKKRSSFSILPFFASIGAFFKRIPIPSKLKKLLPILGISILLLGLLVGFIYLNTALLVKIRIYVEAKEVEIEQVFEGDENITEIDFEEFKIPVKTESVEKARSTTVNATGTAFRGEKATGSVSIFYVLCSEEPDSDPLELPSGTAVSSGGQTYTLDSAVSIACVAGEASDAESSVTAIEIGEEYNLPPTKQFTIQGYSTEEVLVISTGEGITGGSQEEYTVLSKADVDAAVEDLRKIATEEGEGELKDINSKWQIISDSLTSKVLPNSTKTDVAIGAEATNVNVSITTESNASYYLKDGFNDGVERLLTEKAKEENLFETDRDLELELDKEIEKEISVVESNAQGITIKLTAKSTVKPEVNTEEILTDLRSMNWEEGQEYLKSLDFSEKETRVEFFPEWFPESLKRFPKKQGGILITIGDAN